MAAIRINLIYQKSFAEINRRIDASYVRYHKIVLRLSQIGVVFQELETVLS